MLRDKFYNFLSKCATTTIGWWVIGIALAMTLVSAFLMTRLPILTTREGMVDSKLAVQKRYLEFSKDFGAQNQLVILLEGDPVVTRAAATDLAEALLRDPQWVKNVFYRLDLATMRKSGLYYLSVDELQKMAAGLRDYQPLLSRALGEGTWNGLLAALETESARLSTTDVADKKAMLNGLEIFDLFLAEWQQYLETPATAKLDLGEKTFAQLVAKFGDSRADEQGYLIGNQGRMKILFVQQSQSIDNTEYVVPLMKYARATAADVLKKYPGVTVGFTGWPVSIEEEIGLVKSDIAMVGIVAPIIIFLIVWAAARSFHRTLLMFVPVLLSVVWNFGVTYFTIGHLNYLTSGFVGILFGLGIDYGVVFIRRFDEEIALGRTTAEATHNTLTNVGQSVGSGAAATITAFFAIGFTDQPAFSDLGIVAGSGILCALVASFFVHPALVAHFPPKADPKDMARLAESRVLRRAGERVLRRPLILAVVILVAVLAALTQIPRLRFDYNLNNLLAVNSEAVRVGDRLEQATPYKTQFVSVIADDLEQIRRLQKELEGKATVSRVESIAMLLPPDQEEKRRLLSEMAKIVATIPVKTAPPTPAIAALRERVTKSIKRLETAQEDAFGSGLTDLVASLDRLLKRFAAIDAALARPDAAANQAAFETAFFTTVAQARDELLAMMQAPPITLATLDPQMKERFIGQSGRFSTMVFPQKELWDITFLDRFVGDVQQAAEAVFGNEEGPKRITGFGVVYQVTSRMIHRGFVTASWMAGIIIFLLILVDFKNLRDVLLTMFPLITAIVLSLGLLGALGVNLNMANQLFLPILMGIGIDYGIFMIHRWREPDGADLGRLIATMGNALWLAAATAVAGFGSLVFAHHRGMISFGWILVFAITVTMIIAIFGLPTMIKSLRLDNRKKPDLSK
ncbi:MAG: MMPL family transporter [Myxococcales bacterium]|nr:MMPL family transporter [Myxococcales bacterium]